VSEQRKVIDELGARIREVLAASPAQDLERNLKAMLAAGFARLDLVTREEYDAQTRVLERTRAKLAELEARLDTIEKGR
jgi:BMFP domain-containing protein YqiC